MNVVAPFEILVYQKDYSEDHGNGLKDEERLFVPFFIAEIESAMVRLLVSRITVFAAHNHIHFHSRGMEFTRIHLAINGVDQEHAAEENDPR